MINNISQTKLRQMWDAYEQQGAWADGTILQRHDRESDKGYARRCSIIHAPAVYKYLIDTLNVLWATPPVRKDYSDIYGLFISDAGMGLSLDDLLKRALKMSQVEGSAWLVMDSFADQPVDREGMLEERTWPFLRLVAPHDVVDVLVDAVGRLVYFSFKETIVGLDGLAYTQIRIYTPGKLRLQDSEGITIGTFDLPTAKMMPVIPLVTSGSTLASNSLPPSPTMGLYEGQLAITNTNSLIDENMYAQQFSVLVVTGLSTTESLTLGSANGLTLPVGASANFISPSGSPIDLMIKRSDNALTMMIKTFANLITADLAQSGLAKVLDRQTGAMMLKAMAGTLENIEYKIHNIFCDFVAEVADGFTVTYSKDFDLESLTNHIENLTRVMDIVVSEEARTYLRTTLLNKVLVGEDTDDIATIIAHEEAAIKPVEEPTMGFQPNTQPSQGVTTPEV